MFSPYQPKNPSNKIAQSLRQKHKAVFDTVYTPDGYEHRLITYVVDTRALNPDIDQFNRVMGAPGEYEAKKLERDTIAHPITRLTSFVGLPNYCPVGQAQTWANIGNNLVGWQPEATKGRKIFNGCVAPLVLLKNLLFVIPSCARNIIRLGTEYLPALVLKYLQGVILLCKKKFIDSSQHRPLSGAAMVGYSALYVLATVGAVVFGALHFVGQAVTSPITALRSAWKLGDDMMFKVKNETAKKVLGTVAGFFFSALSVAVTVTVYTLLFPLAMHALGALIAGKSIPVISQVVSAVSNGAPAWLTSVGNSVVMPVLGKAFTALGAAVSPAAAGVGFLVGAGVTTAGLAVNRVVCKLKEKWRKSAASALAQDASQPPPQWPVSRRGSTSGLISRMPPGQAPIPISSSAPPPSTAQAVATSAGSGTYIRISAPIPIPASSAEASPPSARFGYSSSSSE